MQSVIGASFIKECQAANTANSFERSETKGKQSLDCCPFACAGRRRTKDVRFLESAAATRASQRE